MCSCSRENHLIHYIQWFIHMWVSICVSFSWWLSKSEISVPTHLWVLWLTVIPPNCLISSGMSGWIMLLNIGMSPFSLLHILHIPKSILLLILLFEVLQVVWRMKTTIIIFSKRRMYEVLYEKKFVLLSNKPFYYITLKRKNRCFMNIVSMTIVIKKDFIAYDFLSLTFFFFFVFCNALAYNIDFSSIREDIF